MSEPNKPNSDTTILTRDEYAEVMDKVRKLIVDETDRLGTQKGVEDSYDRVMAQVGNAAIYSSIQALVYARHGGESKATRTELDHLANTVQKNAVDAIFNKKARC